MNAKGQIGVGAFLMVFIGIIVSLVIIQSSAQLVGETTNLITETNQTVTVAAENASIELKGKNIEGSAVILNATSNATISNGNFTFLSQVGSDGQVSLFMRTNVGSIFASKSVKVTYTYQPDGYIPEAGSRTIMGLIVLFGVIGIAVIALGPTLQNKILDLVG